MNRLTRPQVSGFTHVARAALTTLCLTSVLASAQSAGPSHMITTVASTVPGNGDVNPYGIVVVPRTTGKLVQGNLLISNFNAISNFQGTGTPIVQITPAGHRIVFVHINADHLPGPCTGRSGSYDCTGRVAQRVGDSGQFANDRRYFGYGAGGMPARA